MAVNEDEIKLQFLICGSLEILPSTYVKLRSYFNTHILNLADRLNLRVLKNFRNRNKTCLYCYSSWSGDTTSFKLFPSKKSKFFQVHSNANDEKKIAHINGLRNTLVLKCNVCSKKSFFSLIKRKPVEGVAKCETVESVKKKKKKKDKSCGLKINMNRNDGPFPRNIIHNKRIGNFTETTPLYPSYENSQINQLKLMQNKLNPLSNRSKNLMLNPCTTQKQKRFSKQKNSKLQRLKKAVKKEENNMTKKTLKDFLTLI